MAKGNIRKNRNGREDYRDQGREGKGKRKGGWNKRQGRAEEMIAAMATTYIPTVSKPKYSAPALREIPAPAILPQHVTRIAPTEAELAAALGGANVTESAELAKAETAA